jgi:hypothetical protein
MYGAIRTLVWPSYSRSISVGAEVSDGAGDAGGSWAAAGTTAATNATKVEMSRERRISDLVGVAVPF